MLKFLLTFSLIASSGCSSSVLTDSIRQLITDLHNSYRSSLANGKERTASGGYAPTVKNMYKLKYDCDLESMAQSWANQCVYQHSNVGQNLYIQSNNVDVATALKNAGTLWWQELAQYGGVTSTNTDLQFSSQTGHFTQMAWAKTTKIGCGVQWCEYMKIVVCNYLPAGNYIGEKVYDIGQPCSADNHCTTYYGSTCNASMGLCQTSDYSIPDTQRPQTPAPQPPTQAPVISSPQGSGSGNSGGSGSSCSNVQSDSDCDFWASQGECQQGSGWEGWMAQNCPKSCGTCSGGLLVTQRPVPSQATQTPPQPVTQPPQLPTQPPVPLPECSNIEPDKQCDSLASDGYCMYDIVAKYCPRSCNACGGQDGHNPIPVLRCENKERDVNCAYYAQRGFCNRRKYRSWLSENCQKACKLC